MKKILAMLLALVLVFAFTACAGNNDNNDDTTDTADTTVDTGDDTTEAADDTTEAAVDDTTDTGDDTADVMTYAEYAAAELEAAVTIEAYVQATQSWWDNKITVYAADEDGAYFIYEMQCSEEDSAKLVPGTKIKVTGYKGAWAGEVEIMDATFEFAGDDTYVAEPIDLTAKLGTDELINYQNQLAAFKGMTVEAIEYKNGEPGDDIYLTLGYNGASYNFCVEIYLTGEDSDVYTTVATLNVGDIVDVEGFLYWYEGVNPHVTAINLAAAASATMSYDEYVAAEMDAAVTIEAYVQATQSWWDNKITVYAADEDGAYFIYEMQCSEEDSAKLVPGTKIKVTGYKGAWAGEVEIMDATFEFAGDDTYVAEPIDLTDKLGTDELINYQNQLAAFKAMTVEAIEYKNGEPGDDIYLTLGYNGASYSFCVEIYLTGEDSDVYKTVATLNVGDVVDVEGFVYWYEGVNTHVTAINLAAEAG